MSVVQSLCLERTVAHTLALRIGFPSAHANPRRKDQASALGLRCTTAKNCLRNITQPSANHGIA